LQKYPCLQAFRELVSTEATLLHDGSIGSLETNLAVFLIFENNLVNHAYRSFVLRLVFKIRLVKSSRGPSLVDAACAVVMHRALCRLHGCEGRGQIEYCSTVSLRSYFFRELTNVSFRSVISVSSGCCVSCCSSDTLGSLFHLGLCVTALSRIVSSFAFSRIDRMFMALG
jgi:hypothetical protein